MARLVSIIILITVVFTFYCIHVSYGCCPPPPPPPHVCPKLNVLTANLSDPAQLGAAQTKLMDSLWNSSYPNLTAKGLALKKALLYMVHSDVPRWQLIGGIASAWIWFFIPNYATKPDICSFAKITSASVVNPKSCHYCKKINGAMDAIGEMINDMPKYTIANSLQSAGCPYNQIVASNSTSNCSARDSLCAAKKLWREEGPNYPCMFEKATLRLYKSCNYVDQMMGIIATASLSKQLTSVFMNFNGTVMFQAFQMISTPKIPLCCCDSLMADLNDTMSYVSGSTVISVAAAKKAAGC